MYVVVDKDAIFTVSNHGSHSLLQTQQGGTNNMTNSIHTYLELKGKNEITSGKEAIALGAANGTQNLVFRDPDPGRRWMNDMGIHGALPCPLGRWVLPFGHGARRKARQGVPHRHRRPHEQGTIPACILGIVCMGTHMYGIASQY